ncbi:MAG: hypothetical protein ACKVTZ_15445 [Bacteroidia bacterium]
MPSVCLCFEVHQPIVLRNFRFLDLAAGKPLEDAAKMKANTDYWTEKCYSPLNTKIRELFLKYKGNFRLAFYTSGVLIQQLEQYRPDVLSSFAKLGWTNCAEFLAGTYHHSLAAFISPTTFLEETAQLSTKIRNYFEQEPLVFYSPQCIYTDSMANDLASKSFTGILCEPSEEWLKKANNAQVYTPYLTLPERFTRKPSLLLRNAHLSADLKSIFAKEKKTSPAEYVRQIREEVKRDQVAMLTLRYQDLSDIDFAINFLDQFAADWLSYPDNYFFTPSMTVARLQPKGILSAPKGIAHQQENLDYWFGNSYQQQFLQQLIEMEGAVRYWNRQNWTNVWAQLQMEETFAFLNAHFPHEGNPFTSQKEAFIALSNMLSYLQLQMNR